MRDEKSATSLLGDGAGAMLTNLVALSQGMSSSAVKIHDKGESVIFAFNGELHEIGKPPTECSHNFSTITGFLDYIKSEHCKDKGIIFVGDSRIFADLNYKYHAEREISLQLVLSAEYLALGKLFKGLSQKELWRLLVTDLHGCISKDLLLAISQIKIKKKDENTIDINDTGLVQGEKKNSTIINYAGSTFDIGVDWTWTGQIYEAFDNQVSIDLRLEIGVTGSELTFTFHPRRLQSVLRENTLALVDQLKKDVPENFTVHEGIY